jgi:hypothetical protein
VLAADLFCLIATADHNLPRGTGYRAFFGISEAILLLEYVVLEAATTPARRDALLETAFAVTLTYLTGTRPGALGYSNPTYGKEGKVSTARPKQATDLFLQYLKLKHVRLLREGRGRIGLQVNLINLKVSVLTGTDIDSHDASHRVTIPLRAPSRKNSTFGR